MGVPCGGVTAALVWSGGVRVVHYGVHYVLPTAESLVHVYRARRAPCTRPPPTRRHARPGGYIFRSYSRLPAAPRRLGVPALGLTQMHTAEESPEHRRCANQRPTPSQSVRHLIHSSSFIRHLPIFYLPYCES